MTSALHPRPAAAIWTLIYDGDCGFCARVVDLLRRWDRRRALRFVPLQDEGSLAGLPPLGRSALERAMHLISPAGEVFAGAAAAAPLLRLLPGGAAPALLFRLPGVPALAARGYGWVARNRHRLPGSTPRCEVEADPGSASPDAMESERPATITEDDVRTALRRVKDPELNLNIVDLGLVYAIEVTDGKDVHIEMTLTSPGCPSGPEIMSEAQRVVEALDNVRSVDLELVWTPYWTPDRIDPRLRAFLGG